MNRVSVGMFGRPVGRGGSRGFARTPLPGKAKNNYTHDNLASQTLLFLVEESLSSEQKGGSQLTSRNGISSFPGASERSLASRPRPLHALHALRYIALLYYTVLKTHVIEQRECVNVTRARTQALVIAAAVRDTRYYTQSSTVRHAHDTFC